MSYAANEVTIAQAKAQADIPPEIEDNHNFLTTTLGFKSSSGVKVYNLNVANVAKSSVGRVVFQNCELGDVVNLEGWAPWDDKTSTDNVYFKEFNNNGPSAVTDQRVAYSGRLSASVDITEILGDDYASQWWVDSSFL